LGGSAALDHVLSRVGFTVRYSSNPVALKTVRQRGLCWSNNLSLRAPSFNDVDSVMSGRSTLTYLQSAGAGTSVLKTGYFDKP